MAKYNLKDVKYMHYLDYKLNNTPKGMKQYSGDKYPRLVEFLVQHEKDVGYLNTDETTEARRIYRTLWREGLFRSCQA